MWVVLAIGISGRAEVAAQGPGPHVTRGWYAVRVLTVSGAKAQPQRRGGGGVYLAQRSFVVHALYFIPNLYE